MKPSSTLLLWLMLVPGVLIVNVPTESWAGGTIEGRVMYTGKPVPPKEFAFSKFPNPQFCQKHPQKSEDGTIRYLREVEVGPENVLQNAIVVIKDIQDEEWMNNYSRTEVVAELCEFLPFTGIVVNKQNFYVENHDEDPDDPKSKEGVLHNPHGFDVLGPRSMTLFNIALAQKGSTMEKPLKMRMASKGSVLRLQCDQHEFMQSWFLPVENPYYDKVEKNGTFEIPDVPPGKHTIMAWHPVAGETTAEITVPKSGSVKIDLEIK